jgi:exonuclease VII large subunit
MSEKRAGLFLYADTEEIFLSLSDEEAGQLIKAIFYYNNTGEVKELPGLLRSVFMSFKRTIDENKNRYKMISEKRTAAIQSRWKKEREKDFEKVKETLSAYLSRALTDKEEHRLEQLREKHGNTLIYLAIRESRQAGGRTLKYVEKMIDEYVNRGWDELYKDKPLKDYYKGLYN